MTRTNKRNPYLFVSILVFYNIALSTIQDLYIKALVWVFKKKFILHFRQIAFAELQSKQNKTKQKACPTVEVVLDFIHRGSLIVLKLLFSVYFHIYVS